MKKETEKIFNELFVRNEKLSICKESLKNAFNILYFTIKRNNKILICGNGGSAADGEHIVGELMKKFLKNREIDKVVYDNLSNFGDDGKILQSTLEGAIPAISLSSHIALSTAFANDKRSDCAFAQQVYGLGNEGDCLIAISTSGNSQNCVYAAQTAKAKGLRVLSLTGEKESKLSKLSDCTIKVPETETYKIQELHLPIYHCICAMLEEEIY